MRRNYYATGREDFVALCNFRLKEVDEVGYAVIKRSVFILLQNAQPARALRGIRVLRAEP